MAIGLPTTLLDRRYRPVRIVGTGRPGFRHQPLDRDKIRAKKTDFIGFWQAFSAPDDLLLKTDGDGQPRQRATLALPSAGGNGAGARHVDDNERIGGHMIGADRVALVGWAWFLGWIGIGYLAGRLLLGVGGTGLVVGFIIALLSVPAWPWLLPQRLEDWMCDPRA
jgi:hypothetical protein